MAAPSILCRVCLTALQSSMGDVLETTLHKDAAHHATLASFLEAVGQGCFICTILWNSITDESKTQWTRGTSKWKPLSCHLERRPWAAEWLESIYWRFLYLTIEVRDVQCDYRGYSFCLSPCYTEHGTMYEGSSQKLEASTSSARTHELAREWYQACRKSHPVCRRLASSHEFTPTRLIDVGVDGDTEWKLRLCAEDLVDQPEYATLSYRWSPNPSIVLQSSNIERLCRGVPIHELPLTFREAITVARRFSIRYLWIDSLCILQDSEDDWLGESVKMHHIYASSAFNISASASSGPDGGLFRSRRHDDVSPGFIEVDLPGKLPKIFDIWDEFYIERQVSGPLTRRGWVFQERLLSPRVLHFCKSQVIWECSEMEKCEVFPRWSPYPMMLPMRERLKDFEPIFTSSAAPKDDVCMSDSVFNQWCNHVNQYTKCALTRPDDRLVAMSGIAHLYESQTGDKYLAGLWQSRLLDGLNWVVLAPAAAPDNASRAPSWSWAAVDSVVMLQKAKFPGETYLFTIVDPPERAAGDGSAAQQVCGAIRLEGFVAKATIRSGTYQGSMVESKTKLGVDEIPSPIYVYPDTSATKFERATTIHMLPFKLQLVSIVEKDNPVGRPEFILEGIVVQPLPGEDGAYKRLGRFVVNEQDHLGFFGLEPSSKASPHAGADFKMARDNKTSLISLL